VWARPGPGVLWYATSCWYAAPMSLCQCTHPQMSSCAVAVRAIIMAVGCWICISLSSTLPSLVSLMSVAPSQVERVRWRELREERTQTCGLERAGR
jgi:hypothetical protein